MITDTSSFATSSLITFSRFTISNALISITFGTPIALQSAGILIAYVGSPCRVFPVAAWSWCPVIPVVELSRMSTVPVALLYIIFIRELTPVCRNVESPITATQFLMYSFPFAFSIP